MINRLLTSWLLLELESGLDFLNNQDPAAGSGLMEAHSPSQTGMLENLMLMEVLSSLVMDLENGMILE